MYIRICISRLGIANTPRILWVFVLPIQSSTSYKENTFCTREHLLYKRTPSIQEKRVFTCLARQQADRYTVLVTCLIFFLWVHVDRGATADRQVHGVRCSASCTWSMMRYFCALLLMQRTPSIQENTFYTREHLPYKCTWSMLRYFCADCFFVNRLCCTNG